AERVPVSSRTAAQHNVLSDVPEYSIIIAQLYELMERLNSGGGAKGLNALVRPGEGNPSQLAQLPVVKFDFLSDVGKGEEGAAFSDAADELMPKKRKRKMATLDAGRLMGSSELEVTTNDGIRVSLTLFDMLKTEEKLLLAGISIRMLAAVGGVIRNGNQAILDIKYHMYRLWTCVSRLTDVEQMFHDNSDSHEPGQPMDEQGNNMFAEFVVVKYFTDSFEQRNIEPRIRISKDRTPCPGGLHNLETLIEQAFSSTEEETRSEIPMWLVVSKRQDERYVLALLISSPEIEAPVDETGREMTLFQNRHYSDQVVASVVDSAIASRGNAMMGALPIQCQSGLDPWPWAPGQAQSISVEAGFIGHIPMATEYSETLIVATINYCGVEKTSPWHEPRIMTEVVFDCQQSYANLGVAGHAPLYQHLLQSGALEAMTAAVSTVGGMTRQHSPLMMPSNPSAFSILPDDIGRLDQSTYYDHAPPNDILPVDFGNAYHPELGITAPSSAAILETGPLNGNLPMASTSAVNLLLSPQPYFSNTFIGNYPQNTWAPPNFVPEEPYPQFFEPLDAPEEYQY
ncbi:hypothetical protein IWW38_003788, partial [Coemansia aciculifera]